MSEGVELVAGIVVLLGLWMVGVTQLRSKLGLYGAQTVAVGLLAIRTGYHHHEPALIAAGIAVAGAKGIAIPVYLVKVMHRIGCRRDEGAILAPPLLLMLTMAALGAVLMLQPYGAEVSAASMPAIGVVLIGMVLMVSRRLAISQILGFLVMENGIFLYTVGQPHSMPLLVELGVLLDVLAGTMLAGLLAFRIGDSFDHIDVTELRQLRG